MLYQFLDIFFLIFHSLLIVFNLFGWLFRALLRLNLLALSLTAFSWFVLGIFYGWGYCFLTDWHWEVLYVLDKYPPENSYVQYILRRLLNIKISANFADILTAVLFFASFTTSIVLNLKTRIKH